MLWLTTLFPPTDFTLIAVILGMPLLGAFVNGIWGKRLGKPAVRLMALVAVGASFFACVLAFAALHAQVDAREHAHVKLTWTLFEWMHTTGVRESNVPIEMKFSIDALSGVMMLIVTGVGFLIHLYATSYMEKDPGFARFFAYMNLFIFSMLVLILGDNLPILFVGWEGVGLCSYLLIGFWYEHMPNAQAGKKAFIANRIGDFGLLCAMFLIAHYTGALDWTGIANGAANLVGGPEGQQIHVWPIGGGQYTGILSFLQPKAPMMITGATAVGLALLLGATGKSAQIPLYVWLPDAMAGPTPVSALIHAATMVTAGIYLVCRLSFVFVMSPFVMMLIACIGAATALFAATIALVQNDIKKVLAYSTVSQLGFMFLGVGVGAFTAGFFHVFTHAFFKACLFLGAGSVIHAMHARIHDNDKSQDIRNMGGLRKYMPTTYWTFAAATAAIIGLPMTSGFFSKDEILFKAFTNEAKVPEVVLAALKAQTKAKMGSTVNAKELEEMANAAAFHAPHWLGTALYVVGVLAATMTAFYMCRMFFLTFWGDFRGWTIGRPSIVAKRDATKKDADGAFHAQSAAHDPEHHTDDDAEHHDAHHEEDLTAPGYAPQESPWQMTVPLIVLAAFSVLAGVLNPGFHIMPQAPMEHWLEPVFKNASEMGVRAKEGAEHMEYALALGGVGAFLVGTALAYWMYVAQKGEPARKLAAAQPGLYKLLYDKWRIDELYDATVVAAVDSLAETSAAFDKFFIDGIIAKLSALIVSAAGTILRAFQNGVVHVYAAMMVVGLAAIGWFYVAPHPDATVTEGEGGDYTIAAGPGMGYAYRWDADGNGQMDTTDFGTQDHVKVHLEPGKSQVVGLEVKNAFGLSRTRQFTVSRAANAAPVGETVGQN